MINIIRDTKRKYLFMSLLAVAMIVFTGGGTLAATLLVDPGATACSTGNLGPFTTIQGALSAAAAGDTILVCPNFTTGANDLKTAVPYAGPVDITLANLTIIGISDDDSSLVLIQGNADRTVSNSESRGIVTLDAPNITFGNFTIDGGINAAGAPAPNPGTGAFNGVVVTDDAPGTTVFNTTVRNIINATNIPIANGQGIVVEGGTTTTAVSILNNNITNFRSVGIVVGDLVSVGGEINPVRAIVRGNYISGADSNGTGSTFRQRGIVFDNTTGSAVTGDIFNNRVASLDDSSANIGDAPGTPGAAYSLAGVAAGGVTVRYNQSYRNFVGISVINTNNLTINNNQLHDSTVGIFVAGASAASGSNNNTIQVNQIYSSATAIQIAAGASTANIVRQNTLQNAFIGIANEGIGTTIGSGATANSFVQVVNHIQP